MKDRVISWGLGIASLALYVATAAPTVVTVFDDSLEFQVVLPTLGIAHPTGYPLYTLLGWLSTRLLPFGDAAYRANLFSALTASLTVVLLYRLLLRVVGGRMPALLAAALFAISPLWWSQATLAEVYALHGLFVVALWLVAFDERTAPDAGRWALPVAVPIALPLLSGLALTHHRMTLLLAPGLALWVGLRWWDSRRPALGFRPVAWLKVALLAALLLLAPLLLYAYVWLRGQAIPTTAGVWLNTWPAFWQHISASAYGAFLAGHSASRGASPDIVQLLLAQFGPLAALLGLWGLFPWPLHWRRWAALALTLAIQAAFALSYRTADAEVFFLPVTLLFSLFVAAGLVQAQDAALLLLAQWRRAGLPLPGRFAWYRAAVQAALALLVAWVPVHQAWAALTVAPPGPQICEQALAVGKPPDLTPNRRGDWRVADCAQDILSQPLEPGAAVIGLLGEITLLRYYQQTAGQRPDLLTLVADAEDDRRAAVLATLAEGRPTYLLRPLDGLLASGLALDAVGPLLRVRTTTMAPAPEPPALAQPVAITPQVEIASAASWPVSVHQGRVQRIGIVWQVTAVITDTLQVSARLLDAAGQIVAQYDGEPVHRARPTLTWRPGERIVDVYDLPLQGQGPFTPLLILYRAADGREVGRLALPGFD
ncbi:MAG: DUF2723 domain-containing protein [Anaerolineae bacterium]|nr:DUF2723 domain-containing protein [Anaerolineae bacterium]